MARGSHNDRDERLILARRRWPELARALAGASPPREPTPAGDAVRLPDAQGRPVTLYPPRDPVGAARRDADKALGGAPASPIVLFGTGGGYRIAEALCRCPPDGRVIAVALNERALVVAIENLDGAALADPRLSILLGDAAGFDALRDAFSGAGGAVWIDAAELRVADPFARALADALDIFQTHGAASESQLARIRENMCVNAGAIAAASPVRSLFGRLSGGVAIVCGAGPSLVDGAHDIARRRDRAFVIAVEAAIAPLAARGVTPDLAVSVDPYEANALQCASLLVHPPLVFMPGVHPAVAAAWRGPTFAALAAGDPVAEALDAKFGAGLLESGGIVGTAACALAARLGAGRIVLCGMDLAFTGGRTHADGAHHAADAAPSPYDARVPAIGGGEVATNETFRRAIAWFGRFADEYAASIALFDSGRGARKRGFAPATLAEALDGAPPAAFDWPGASPLAPGAASILASLDEAIAAYEARS